MTCTPRGRIVHSVPENGNSRQPCQKTSPGSRLRRTEMPASFSIAATASAVLPCHSSSTETSSCSTPSSPASRIMASASRGAWRASPDLGESGLQRRDMVVGGHLAEAGMAKARAPRRCPPRASECRGARRRRRRSSSHIISAFGPGPATHVKVAARRGLPERGKPLASKEPRRRPPSTGRSIISTSPASRGRDMGVRGRCRGRGNSIRSGETARRDLPPQPVPVATAPAPPAAPGSCPFGKEGAGAHRVRRRVVAAVATGGDDRGRG